MHDLESGALGLQRRRLVGEVELKGEAFSHGLLIRGAAFHKEGADSLPAPQLSAQGILQGRLGDVTHLQEELPQNLWPGLHHSVPARLWVPG